jgi:Fe-S cluster assembly protein SufD
MENIQNIYDTNIKSILGGNLDYFRNYRQEIIKNFALNSQLVKDNESTKHIDRNVLNNLNFKINNSSLHYKHLNEDKLDSSIIVKNGIDYSFINLNNQNVIINPLNCDFDLLMHKLEKNKDLLKDDYIVNLNSIFLNSGFDFTLKENSNLRTIISHQNDQPDSTVYAKNFLNIKKNSKLLLIEKFVNQTSSNSNIINYFELEEGSEVLHLVIQNNSNESNIQFTSHTTCHKNSVFNQLVFNSGDVSLRNHHYVNLIGEHSEANLKGIFFAGKKQIIDNKTNVSHLNHSCSSNQIYKGVLTDNAKASYLSKTYVDKQAQKTDGYQLSKGILLSEDAYFHSKPELKIFADNVKCSHGSTIGPFDNEEIFYLRTRGINNKDAKSLLIKAFSQDLLSKINDVSYLSEADTLIDEWLMSNID